MPKWHSWHFMLNIQVFGQPNFATKSQRFTQKYLTVPTATYHVISWNITAHHWPQTRVHKMHNTNYNSLTKSWNSKGIWILPAQNEKESTANPICHILPQQTTGRRSIAHTAWEGCDVTLVTFQNTWNKMRDTLVKRWFCRKKEGRLQHWEQEHRLITGTDFQCIRSFILKNL